MYSVMKANRGEAICTLCVGEEKEGVGSYHRGAGLGAERPHIEVTGWMQDNTGTY